jgi:hypothetical protein
MTPQQTGSQRSKRLLAIAAATLVAVGGTIGLAFAADSGDTGADTVKPVVTAPPSPPPTGTHWPTPPPDRNGSTTRSDGGPEEGTRGPSSSEAPCIDPDSGGRGPQHC